MIFCIIVLSIILFVSIETCFSFSLFRTNIVIANIDKEYLKGALHFTNILIKLII